MLPAVTLLGLSLSGLLGGSVIVETIFSWPGVGKYVVECISARDYPVIQGYVMMATAIVAVSNLVVDLTYAILDPRVRKGYGG